MSIESRVRKIYERRPYPPPALRRTGGAWSLPPLEWINTVREQREGLNPRRILVAGCGAGSEAFTVAERFPDAEVVAVDFSERSIVTARRMQRSVANGSRIRFETADLSDPKLLETTGRRFDLITCYGVISYIPDTAAVFRNFARALVPQGIVILGTNGAGHPSARFRPVLENLGFAPDEFRESRRVRDAIHALDLLSAYPPAPLASKPAGFLAGDLFGPLNRAASLAEWKTFYEGAGLHLLASHNAYFPVRRIINDGLQQVIMPRTRAEVAELVDVLHPASFHQLVLGRRAPARAPWELPRRLLKWKPIRTALFRFRWPRRKGRANDLLDVRLESRVMGTEADLTIPQWEIDILQRCDGEQTTADLLRRTRAAIPPSSVADAMYVLYHLGAVNVLP